MNAENFPQFLRRPERLWALNEHELRSLVLEYPYSANLRLLLAQKAKMEGWSDADRLLTMAAVYHRDRKQLHWQMQLLPTQRPEETPTTIEEVLELKPLDRREPPLPALSELERTPPAPAETPRRARIIPGAGSEPPAAPPATTTPDEPELVWPVELPPEAPAPKAGPDLDHAAAIASALPLPELAPPELNAEAPPPPIRFELSADTVADVAAGVGAVGRLTWTGRSPEAATPPYVPSAELVATVASGIGALPAARTPNATAVPPPAYRPAAELLRTVVAGSRAVPEWTPAPPAAAALAPEEVIAPLPVETLPSFREQYRPARLATLSELLKEREAPRPPKRKKAKRRKPKTKEMAQRSLETDGELASETLAQLLERQGHYERAMAMYERLRLSDPEKSGFFAARIRDLQARLDQLPPA